VTVSKIDSPAALSLAVAQAEVGAFVFEGFVDLFACEFHVQFSSSGVT
jgi:hypothetical protein